MARRISSIFSLGSNISDRTESSNDSRLPSSIHPARPPRDRSPANLTAKSTPELRPTSNLQDLHNTQSSGLTPPFNPSLLPRIDDDHPLLQPSQHLSPYPVRSKSPVGSRPASIGSRPQSGAENYDFLNHPPNLLKPLSIRTESPSGGRPVSRGSGIGSSAGSRPGSRLSSRPSSPTKSRPQTPTAEQKLGRRRSWLPGRFKTEAQEEGRDTQISHAAIITPQGKLPYDISPLANFQKVPDLWNEEGDTLVYLHSREFGRGPSFKFDSSLIASSRKLTVAAHGTTHGNVQRGASELRHGASELRHRSYTERAQHLAVNSDAASPPLSRPGSSTKISSKDYRSISDYFDEPLAKNDIHLCLPVPLQADLSNPTAHPTVEDLEVLVTMRNVFAFLAGQSLVSTPKQSSLFKIFLKIADVMQRYEFTNLDGSTLGEEAAGSFARITEEWQLADVRASREKTIEAIVLGERMRSSALYNEGFVHAVGKYEDISGLKSHKYGLIADVTRKRLERAHLDLSARLRNIQNRLGDFDFPSLFAGVANSTSSMESKVIRFKDWRSSYMSMRRHVLTLYRFKYGAWPPRAKSKKNDFEESGLNRLLLRDLYQDFSDLYDILVDRTALTTRTVDGISQNGSAEPEDPRTRCLRRVIDEYDRSTPPVLPPVPFDIARLPSLSDTRRGFDALDPKKQKKRNLEKLSDDEINNALMQSYNRDSVRSTPFIEAFMAFERRSAHGKSMEEIQDLRDGQWLFMYAVLQSLPLVVVDAPGVQWTKGVEYFLCEVPKGSAPWVQENPTMRQSWYGIAGGSGIISLPADVVEHGVEGIYHRSHCWQVAEKWNGFSEPVDDWSESTLRNDQLLSPVLPSERRSRTVSQSPNRRASTAMGLEQLPLPPGVVPSGSRPLSVHDPSKTFGAILAERGGTEKKKKKKK